MGLTDRFREGAYELFGMRPEMNQLREAAQDARLLARKAEDVGWAAIDSSGPQYKQQPENERRDEIRRAFKYYWEDPVIKQAVNLVTWYTFGRGLGMPKYGGADEATAAAGESNEDADQEKTEAERLIKLFWEDEDNQRVLTTAQSQEMKSTELQLQGQVLFLLFPGDPPPDQALSGAAIYDTPSSPLKVTDLPEEEIVDVIMHPENRKIPVYYKRQSRQRVYDFRAGTYSTSETTPKISYHRDWRHEAPKEIKDKDGKMVPWGPPEKLIEDGYVYHVKVNCVSDSKFGRCELSGVLDWARGLNSYMTARMNVVQAISQIALRVKAKGGPRQLSQVASQLADISRLSAQIEGSTTRRNVVSDQNKTRIAVENQGTDLQPAVTDTGAGSASIDIQTLLGQVSAGTGIPPHYFGNSGSASLATATAMELPVMKMMEARQELWENVYRDILGWMLRRAGLDPSRLEVQMPPILARDLAATTSSLGALTAAVDPQGQNKEFLRWVVGEILDTMGKVNSKEILDRIFPQDWEPSSTVANASMMQMQLQAQQAAQDMAPPEDNAGAQRTQAAASSAAASAGKQQATAARNGADRSPSARGGVSSSQRASQARQDRAAGRVGSKQSEAAELFGEPDFVEADREAFVASLPEAAQQSAREALMAFDGLSDELLGAVDA